MDIIQAIPLSSDINGTRFRFQSSSGTIDLKLKREEFVHASIPDKSGVVLLCLRDYVFDENDILSHFATAP